MPTFVCDRCHSIDNTALTVFHIKRNMVKHFGPEFQNNEAICSGCTPQKYQNGSTCKLSGWHNRFPREIANKKWLKSINISALKKTSGLNDVINNIPPSIEVDAPQAEPVDTKVFDSLLD